MGGSGLAVGGCRFEGLRVWGYGFVVATLSSRATTIVTTATVLLPMLIHRHTQTDTDIDAQIDTERRYIETKT